MHAGYEINAVSTTRQESADAAAAHYGIPQAFAGYEALVTSPDVDLAVVTVKVPAHLELVIAAIKAGKHIYCEWPLGNGLAEAKQMAELARSRGARTVIGLQARVSPTISYVRDLVGPRLSWYRLVEQLDRHGPELGRDDQCAECLCGGPAQRRNDALHPDRSHPGCDLLSSRRDASGSRDLREWQDGNHDH